MDIPISSTSSISDVISKVDAELSQRFISLDPRGYFLISLDMEAGEIVVEHFSNDIDEKGRAIDPETGEVLGCSNGARRASIKIYRGLSAKQVGIQLTEDATSSPLSSLDHAMYLGRELQRAEACLVNRMVYVQD